MRSPTATWFCNLATTYTPYTPVVGREFPVLVGQQCQTFSKGGFTWFTHEQVGANYLVNQNGAHLSGSPAYGPALALCSTKNCLVFKGTNIRLIQMVAGYLPVFKVRGLRQQMLMFWSQDFKICVPIIILHHCTNHEYFHPDIYFL